MKTKPSLRYLVALGCLVSGAVSGQAITGTGTNALSGAELPSDETNSIVLPAAFNDPIEPFNRAMWGFNTGFMAWFVSPVSTVYRDVVVKPVRTGIAHMGENLTYPVRLLNNLLQGNLDGAGNETGRCLCNTILGVGGFFDFATKWGIPKTDANFGQTLQKWGCQPGFYLMLPVFGPSDGRDAVGLVGDTAAEPQSYFFPYDLMSTGVTANDFSDTVESSVRFSRSEADSYSILENAWSFSHESRKVDLNVSGSQDEAALETLQAALLSFTNTSFPAKSKTRSVLIPSTGKDLPFTYWMRPGVAPVVYLVPGFGAHRLSGNELALAELVYNNGFSVVCISSTFHPEFMERAATTDLPSYPPQDVQDLRVVLTAIDNHLQAEYPRRLGSRALMGYSMGGFQSLWLAGEAATNKNPAVRFDRYVAIDSPVNLRYSVTNLDRYYEAALAWPAAERTRDIENTILKVVALSKQSPKPGAVLPFNAIESKFLIGLSQRLTLRDVIFDSQLRHNQGVLKHVLKKSNRHEAYDEIMNYSFWDYINRFALPYDKSRGLDMLNPDVASRATDLRTYTEALKANQNVRYIANRNDFLLSGSDLGWVEATLDPKEVTLFEHGGHLGNLYKPEVQQAVLDALDGLGAKPAQPKSQASLGPKHPAADEVAARLSGQWPTQPVSPN